MRLVLITVEGPQDAALFAMLAKHRRFAQLETEADLPPLWRVILEATDIGKARSMLNRVLPFPDFHIASDGSASLAVQVARGDGAALVESMVTALDVRENPSDIHAVGLVTDADRDHTASARERFDALIDLLDQYNRKQTDDGVPGYPLSLPAAPGGVANGVPKVGVLVLPDNLNQGTLEDIVIPCCEPEHSEIVRNARAMVAAVDAHYPERHKAMKKLRKPSGRQKAVAGIVSNILAPGAALSAGLLNDHWLTPAAIAHPAVKPADDFLSALLA